MASIIISNAVPFAIERRDILIGRNSNSASKDPPGQYQRSKSIKSIGITKDASSNNAAAITHTGRDTPGHYNRSMSTKSIGTTMSTRSIDSARDFVETHGATPGRYSRSKSTRCFAISTRHLDVSRGAEANEDQTSHFDETVADRPARRPSVRFAAMVEERLEI